MTAIRSSSPIASEISPQSPAESTSRAPITVSEETSQGNSRYYPKMHGSDFGRLKVLSVMNIERADSNRRKSRRRFARKQLLPPDELRGKGHPAALDGRYRRVFPWRDQTNQLYVHPELADQTDHTKVAPGLRLLKIKVDKEAEEQIRRDITNGLFPEHSAYVHKLSKQDRILINDRYALLLANLHASLKKTMCGEEPVPPEEVYVRTLGLSDLAPGETALKGQYGLFNRRNAQGQWRTVDEGFHLCFFSGCFCRSAAEYAVECARYSEKEVGAYALTVGNEDTNYPCISPYGGGDLGQFANSALVKNGNGRLVEDHARINTRFAYAEAVFEDTRVDGTTRYLMCPVVFLYMLAMPHRDDELEREARVLYGQPYWDSIDMSFSS